MKHSWHVLLASALIVGATVPVITAESAAAASGDITSAVLAGQNVVLSGASVVHVPPGSHTYTGVISGTGTLRVSGTGTLVLTKDSTFTLPPAQQHQSVTVPGGNHPYVVIQHPDTPAITVDAGATLQYGNGGKTGLIGAFRYNTPGYPQNQDNIRVDGTLRLSLTRLFNLGVISGSGVVIQPRNMWGTLQVCGTNPFSGVIDNGTGVNFAATTCSADLPDAHTVLNRGSWIIDTPLDHTIVQRQTFYSREYGNDINVHSRPGSKVVLTGTYSWSDRGGESNPSLSDQALNWQPVAHNLNKRGTNIEGADVQWGDGTTHQIFMPGTAQTIYINLHAKRERSRLTFDYDGPVTLGAPIGGGVYHDTLSAPGAGDIVIAGTRGNDVTFAAPQFYDGSTTIEKNATLHLGSGAAGGDGGLYTKGSLDKIVDNGSLVARNAKAATVLPEVSGSGSITQSGTAPLSLSNASYTGSTTVTKGTLNVSGRSLSASSGVRLTGSAAVLNLSAADVPVLRQLEVVKGAKILLGGSTPRLTVGSTTVSASGGTLTIGAARFSVDRSGGMTILTALTSTAGSTAAPVSSAVATTRAASTAPARAGGSATQPPGSSETTASDSMAKTGSDAGRMWGMSSLGAFALAIGAGAFAFVRSRSRSRTATRHSR
jgi:autotransporter-associated beta strand protein